MELLAIEGFIKKSVLQFGVNLLRSHAANGLDKVNSSLAHKVSDILRPSIQLVQTKIESMVDARLKKAAHNVKEALIIIKHCNVQDVSPKENVHIWCLDLPIDAKDLLKQAKQDAEIVFLDKKNPKPIERIKALEIMLFCTSELNQTKPEICLDLLALNLNLISDDVILQEAVQKNAYSNLPVVGNKEVFEAMRQFYIELRSTLCSFAIVWPASVDFSKLIETLNNLFLPPSILTVPEKSISDGVVLISTKARRPVLITCRSIAEHNVMANILLLTGAYGSTKYSSDYISLDLNKLVSTPQKQLQPKTRTIKERFTVTLDTKDQVVRLMVWLENGKRFKTDKITPHECNGTGPSATNYKIVHIHEQKDNKDKLLVDIVAECSSDVHQIFTMQCDREGNLEFKGLRCQFQLSQEHTIRWSKRFQCYEVIQVKKSEDGFYSEIVIFRVDEKKCKLKKFAVDQPVIRLLNKPKNFHYHFLVLDEYLIFSCEHLCTNYVFK